MKLRSRGVIGTGFHRAGWPRTVEALRAVADGRGCLLDDFADATFSYQPARAPYREPWIGIFHHPVRVQSPLASDARHALERIAGHRHWAESRRWLRGAIALCDEVAQRLRTWLKVPVLAFPHPTEFNVPCWEAGRAIEERRLVQAGFCLRNTQAIFQVAPAGWHRMQLFGASPWYNHRDDALRRRRQRPDVRRTDVRVQTRLNNVEYDALLASSVVLTELYGAAANNLIVECITRGTPILVNRLPAVEEYLGRDYPLFYGNFGEIDSLLEPPRLRTASEHLLARSQILPGFDAFAERVLTFVKQQEAC